MNKTNKRIVITGLGPLSSAGIGAHELWKNIQSNKTGLSRNNIYLDGRLWDSFWYHKVQKFNINHFGLNVQILNDVKKWLTGHMDRDLLYLLAATQLALRDSGLAYNNDSNNIGLIVTTEHPGMEPLFEDLLRTIMFHLNSMKQKRKKTCIYDVADMVYQTTQSRVYNTQSFMYLFHTAKMFNLHGYSLFTNNACASGLFALEAAARHIQSGKCDAMVVAGGDYPGTLFKHRWFKERNLYASDGRIKPFSSNADGLVFGDGASALILEELRHAKRRKARIYAEYMGGGFSLEGWKVTVPQLNGRSYQQAISAALADAGLKTRDIDVINPHGAGIKMTDSYEARAIAGVFGKIKEKQPLISAFKPYVGHNLGGSALLESIILLLSLKHNMIPPILNLSVTDNPYDLNLVTAPVYKRLKTGMKTACGFAGYNAAVIFSKEYI